MSRGSLVGLLFTVMVLTQPARAQETRRPHWDAFSLSLPEWTSTRSSRSSNTPRPT